MKHALCLILVYCLFAAQATAQVSEHGQEAVRSPFLFEEFTYGTVLFKSGAKKAADFNYNLVTEQMLFKQADGVWALENPGVDTITIGGRKFVPFDKAFCEIIPSHVGVFYIRHHATLLDKGNPVGYGGYTQTSNSGSLPNTAILGTYQALERMPRFLLQDQSVYWVRTAERFFRAHSRQHLQKAFPDKKKKIDALVREQRTDFSKLEDVVALLEQLY